MARKYKLLPVKIMTYIDHQGNEQTHPMRQLLALRDIPLHKVSKGDLGGYVLNKHTLYQHSDSWIQGNAIVIGSTVAGKALVSDNAVVINSKIYGFARIRHNAIVADSEVSQSAICEENTCTINSKLKGEMIASGSAKLESVSADGLSKVSGNAVINNVYMSGRPEISESAKVFKGFVYEKTKIKGSSNVFNSTLKGSPIIQGNATVKNTNMETKALVDGQATIENSVIKAEITVGGNAHINGASVSGKLYFSDEAVAEEGSNFSGENRISGDAYIPAGFHATDMRLDSGIAVEQYKNNLDATKEEYDSTVKAYYRPSRVMRKVDGNVKTIPASDIHYVPQNITIQAPNIYAGATGDMLTATETTLGEPIKQNPYMELLTEIEASYEAYTRDIVKLIKYPSMVDMTVVEVCDFVMALRNVKRQVKLEPANVPNDSIANLERLFVIAENKARTLSTSLLDDTKKRSLRKANDALAVAFNTEATEHERVAGFKSGVSNLDGIIDVSNEAMIDLKAKIGLKELLM